jgi:hypothetical protein
MFFDVRRLRHFDLQSLAAAKLGQGAQAADHVIAARGALDLIAGHDGQPVDAVPVQPRISSSSAET